MKVTSLRVYAGLPLRIVVTFCIHFENGAIFLTLLKVLLRRNFDVMFITKNHFYQLINEDCHLKFD